MNRAIRYTLTVPSNDNDGNTLARLHESVRDTLAERFDGFSSWEGVGYWGGEHAGSEPVVYYVIDTDDSGATDWLRGLAHYVKAEGRQDAVYLTAQPINFELI